MIDRILKRQKLENRIDDKIETLVRRIESYEKETLPMLESLSKYSPVLKINGDMNELSVHKSLFKGLRYLL